MLQYKDITAAGSRFDSRRLHGPPSRTAGGAFSWGGMEAAGVSGRAQSARPRSGAGRRRCRTPGVQFERAGMLDRAAGASELPPPRDAEDAAEGGTGGPPAASIGTQW